MKTFIRGRNIYIVGGPIDALTISSLKDGYEIIIVESEDQVPAQQHRTINTINRSRRPSRPPRRVKEAGL